MHQHNTPQSLHTLTVCCSRSTRPSRLLPYARLACPVYRHVIFQAQLRITFQLYRDDSNTIHEECSDRCQEEPARPFARASVSRSNKTQESWKRDAAVHFLALAVEALHGPKRKQANLHLLINQLNIQNNV